MADALAVVDRVEGPHTRGDAISARVAEHFDSVFGGAVTAKPAVMSAARTDPHLAGTNAAVRG